MEQEFAVDSKSISNDKSNAQLLRSSNGQYSSISRKWIQTQHSELLHETKQRCMYSRKNSISTPGSSEESSDLGTVYDLEERSPSTGTYDVSIIRSGSKQLLLVLKSRLRPKSNGTLL